MAVNLSKSKIMAGLQCPKRLYLQVHNPELAGELDEMSESMIEQGYAVGRLAQKVFPGGLLIHADNGLSRAIALTAEAVARGQVPALFEATFEHDGILVKTDILERQANGHWRLIEVKSTTGVKEQYLYDVAIQHAVLEGCGIKAAPALMHLNSEYVYDGSQYLLEKLFCIEDLTGQIAALPKSVPELGRELRKMLSQAQPPDVEPGPQCEYPYTCEFYDVCNNPLPEGHVTHLPRLSDEQREELKARGIELIVNIPEDFSLTERQKRALECAKSGKPWFGSGLNQRLSDLQYPIHFMDFETLLLALPRFAGMRPYDQLPFQWSIHVQRYPGAAPEHCEFLAESEGDPRPSFAESLCQAIDRRGSIVVYYQAFESGRLDNLAIWLPKYADKISGFQGRLWDLLDVVRENAYHPSFRGSYSLKSVLPALVPDLSYEGMQVPDGCAAGLAWQKMLRCRMDDDERSRLRAALLAYCKQDTLAMVRLLQILAAA